MLTQLAMQLVGLRGSVGVYIASMGALDRYMMEACYVSFYTVLICNIVWWASTI